MLLPNCWVKHFFFKAVYLREGSEAVRGRQARPASLIYSRSGNEQGVAMKMSKVLSVLLIATVVAGVLANLPDIKRYIRISTM